MEIEFSVQSKIFDITKLSPQLLAVPLYQLLSQKVLVSFIIALHLLYNTHGLSANLVTYNFNFHPPP